MAEPNISLLGATYSGVKGVTLPKSGGGTATFPWVEGSETKTANGTYDVTNLAQLIVNVSGGGGDVTIETGTYTPSKNTAKPTISFSKTHSKLPVFAAMIDADGYISTSNSCIYWYYVNWEQLIGGAVYVSTSSVRYGEVRYAHRASNASSLSSSSGNVTVSESDTGDSSNAYPRFSVTESGMMPYNGSTSRYWRSGRTYKWIAVWKP
jgi:hypothetical protein